MSERDARKVSEWLAFNTGSVRVRELLYLSQENIRHIKRYLTKPSEFWGAIIGVKAYARRIGALGKKSKGKKSKGKKSKGKKSKKGK